MIENSSYLKTEINNYMSDTKDVKVFLDTFEKLPKEIYDLEKLIYSNNISLNEIESKKVLLETKIGFEKTLNLIVRICSNSC